MKQRIPYHTINRTRLYRKAAVTQIPPEPTAEPPSTANPQVHSRYRPRSGHHDSGPEAAARPRRQRSPAATTRCRSSPSEPPAMTGYFHTRQGQQPYWPKPAEQQPSGAPSLLFFLSVSLLQSFFSAAKIAHFFRNPTILSDKTTHPPPPNPIYAHLTHIPTQNKHFFSTTFSTFSKEGLMMLQNNNYAFFALYI